MPPKLKTPTTRKAAGGSGVSFRKVPKFRIVDESLLPDEYVMRVPNMKKIERVVKAGVMKISGVFIWIESIPVTWATKF